jgi:hypothetical protein
MLEREVMECVGMDGRINRESAREGGNGMGVESKGKGNSKFHPITGHEGPEGE